jgi:hypothetical protein
MPQMRPRLLAFTIGALLAHEVPHSRAGRSMFLLLEAGRLGVACA